MQQLTQPVQVLHDERLIQTILMPQRRNLVGTDRGARRSQRRHVRRQEVTRGCLDDHKNDERVNQQKERQQQQPLSDVASHLVAKKYCSVRVFPGVRSGQSLPVVGGTLCSFVLTTTTPCTIGVSPTVPISNTLSAQMRNSSCAACICPSRPTVRAVSTSCMIRLIGSIGSTPSLPPDVSQRV